MSSPHSGHVHLSTRAPGRPDAPAGPYARRATSAPRLQLNDGGDGAVATGGGADEITAAVEGLCACPCRAPLAPDGPSAYFATESCQQGAYQARTHRPNQVLDRDDPTEEELLDDVAAADGLIRRVWPSVLLSFRRFCVVCCDSVEATTMSSWTPAGVVAGTRNPHGTTNLDVVRRIDTWQECNRCGSMLAAPALSSRVWALAGNRWRLELWLYAQPGQMTETVVVQLPDMPTLPVPDNAEAPWVDVDIRHVDAVKAMAAQEWKRLESALLARVADPVRCGREFSQRMPPITGPGAGLRAGYDGPSYTSSFLSGGRMPAVSPGLIDHRRLPSVSQDEWIAALVSISVTPVPAGPMWTVAGERRRV